MADLQSEFFIYDDDDDEISVLIANTHQVLTCAGHSGKQLCMCVI